MRVTRSTKQSVKAVVPRRNSLVHSNKATRRQLLSSPPQKRMNSNSSSKRTCVKTRNVTTVDRMKVGAVRSAQLDQRRSHVPLQQPTKQQKFKSVSTPDLSKQLSQQSCSHVSRSVKRTHVNSNILASSGKRHKHSNDTAPDNAKIGRQSTETQTDRLRKGPPCKGIALMHDLQKRKRYALSPVNQESDSEYEPSDDNRQDNSEFSSDSDNEDDCGDTSTMSASVAVTVNEDWNNLPTARKHKRFQESWTEQVADCSPNDIAGPYLQPVEFYNLFLDSDVISLMVRSTNAFIAYADRCKMQANLKPHSRLAQWSNVDESEMKQFVGLLIWMGLVSMPSIDCYWRQDKLYRNMVAPHVISRNRFQAILRMWHFADEDNVESSNRLKKVSGLIELLVNKFSAVKVPGADMVVDESMVPFRGRLKFRQYMPGKSHKYGMFKLCDPHGYTYNVVVYSGKQETTEKDLATKVVMSL